MSVKLTKCLAVVLLLLTGCQDADRAAGQTDRKAAEGTGGVFARMPEPGTVAAYPPVPLPGAVKEADTVNLLTNAGFERGLADWQVIPAAAESEGFDTFAADGNTCFRVGSSDGGEVLVSQDVGVTARSCYEFSALVFARDGGSALAQVQGLPGGRIVKGSAASGPMSAWTRISVVFVTGLRPGKVQAVVACSVSGGADVFIDHCVLSAAPAENLMPSGSMETAPDSSQMPAWYVGGRGALPVSPGFDSEHCIAIPGRPGQNSKAHGLFLTDNSMAGRTVLVSGVMRVSAQEKAPGVTLTLRLPGPDGKYEDISAPCPATGEWEEVTLQANLPAYAAPEGPGAPHFPYLVVNRPADIEGEVLIDEVMVLALPNGGVAGAVSAPQPVP